MYDYFGSMDKLKKRLLDAGITPEEFDIEDYIGLSYSELEWFVDCKIAAKKKEKEKAKEE